MSTHTSRRLKIETLEDRRMLAVMTVTSLNDGSLASLAGDGELSLREAVEAINTGSSVDGIGPTSGVFGSNDTVAFDSGLFSDGKQNIFLTAGELQLSEPMSIQGPGQHLLSIDAQQNSRVLNITEISGNFTVASVTLTGGQTTGLFEGGGAVRSSTNSTLLLEDATVTNSNTQGVGAAGGGIFASGDLSLNASTISHNSTSADAATGGGIHVAGSLSLVESTIANNSTSGSFANGGGILAMGSITVASSTVSDNRTEGSASAGGGIIGQQDVVLTESTVSGNRTLGTNGFGGGISAEGALVVTRSTVTNNIAAAQNSSGGGITTIESPIIISGSIVAGNSAAGGAPDIGQNTGSLSVTYSLIGNSSGTTLNPNSPGTNLIGSEANPVEALLGPLAENGGPTHTNALLPGSPALDSGNANISSPPSHDQRGAAFQRVVDGDGDGVAVIDIGAYEAQALPSADFDEDGDVDGKDFLSWQRGFGTKMGALKSEGNADDDMDVDASDRTAWEVEFGNVQGPPALQAIAITDVSDGSQSNGSDSLVALAARSQPSLGTAEIDDVSPFWEVHLSEQAQDEALAQLWGQRSASNVEELQFTRARASVAHVDQSEQNDAGEVRHGLEIDEILQPLVD